MIFCQHVDHLQDDLHGEAVEELNTDIEEVLVRSEGYISVDRTIPGYHIRSASYNSEVSLYKISDWVEKLWLVPPLQEVDILAYFILRDNYRW